VRDLRVLPPAPWTNADTSRRVVPRTIRKSPIWGRLQWSTCVSYHGYKAIAWVKISVENRYKIYCPNLEACKYLTYKRQLHECIRHVQAHRLGHSPSQELPQPAQLQIVKLEKPFNWGTSKGYDQRHWRTTKTTTWIHPALVPDCFLVAGRTGDVLRDIVVFYSLKTSIGARLLFCSVWT
jgi:hypothetical protein